MKKSALKVHPLCSDHRRPDLVVLVWMFIGLVDSEVAGQCLQYARNLLNRQLMITQ